MGEAAPTEDRFPIDRLVNRVASQFNNAEYARFAINDFRDILKENGYVIAKVVE